MRNREDSEERFRRFLDGELAAEEEREFLHRIADDGEMRALLRLELQLGDLSGTESGAGSFEVPGDFADRVMQSIDRMERRESVAGSVFGDLAGRLKQLFRTLTEPRPVQLRPVTGLAAIAAAVALLVMLPNSESARFTIGPEVRTDSAHPVIAENESNIWIRFVFLDNEAETVAVAGDFSDWDPVSLSREVIEGQQVWTGLVQVSRGEQRYMFVRDGTEWVTDPLAEIQREDGFGNKNAVLFL